MYLLVLAETLRVQRGAEHVALFSCYSFFVAKNITIKISDELAIWARRKAGEENTSVSRLVSEMLERQMRLSDEYWRAYERWRGRDAVAAQGGGGRMGREELHERR